MFNKYLAIEGLTNLLGSDRYYVDQSGNIEDVSGKAIPTIKDDEGFVNVEIDGYLGYRRYRLADLLVLQFKGIRFSQDLYPEIVAFHIDDDKDNLHCNNLGYRFRNTQLPVPNFPGLYFIPMFTRYGINHAGDVVDLASGKYRRWVVSKPRVYKNITGGYYRCSLQTDYGIHKTMARHRLILLALFGYPNNVDKLVVNHKNGKPGDDRLDNLEWLTRFENLMDAVKTGLRSQNIHVLARNVLTGEVTDFFSISECARQLGYPKGGIIELRLKEKFSKVWQDGFQFKLKSDTRDWIIPDDPQKEIDDAIQNKEAKVRCCLTNNIIHFASMNKAAKHVGVTAGAIAWRWGHQDYSPINGYQIIPAEPNMEFPPFTLRELYVSYSGSDAMVNARNLRTQETINYRSYSDIRSKNRNYVIARLRKHRQPLDVDAWQYKHIPEEWQDIPNFEDLIEEMSYDLVGRCEETGKVIITNGPSSMGRLLGICRKAISKHAESKGKNVYKGYRFRYGISNDPWPTQGTVVGSD